MLLKRIYIGTITFTKETLSVTDPCYNEDVWCRLDSVQIFPGTYDCYCYKPVKKDGTLEENRPMIAQIVLQDGFTEDKINEKESWRFIGEIGVDAGLAGFFQNKPDFKDEEWFNFCDNLWKEDGEEKDETVKYAYFYEENDKSAKGFFTSSGYGDGGYPVYAIYDSIDGKHRIAALEIRFLEEAEEE